MDIVDIPDQVGTVFKYSLSSRRSFILSIVAASIVLGAAFDVLYGFFYTRAFNVKDPHYGAAFWAALIVIAILVPIGQGVIRIAAARRSMEPFGEHVLGVAIAPFDVSSLDPDTISTAKKLAALDEAMRQYFGSAQRAVQGAHWMDDFEFRFLPPYVHVHSKEDAGRLRASLRATLFIWGEIQQQAGQPLRMAQHLLGSELDMNISGAIDLGSAGVILAYFALGAAASLLKERGLVPEARAKWILARGPAQEMDKLTKSTSNSELVERCVAELQQPSPAKTTADPAPAP